MGLHQSQHKIVNNTKEYLNIDLILVNRFLKIKGDQ